MKNQEIVEIFYWEDSTLRKLERKNLADAPRLVDKKCSLIVPCFLEKFGLMIGPDTNLSQNAGFESFTYKWNRAQNI